MLHVCAFGGYEGPLSQEKKLYFTIFGGCELRRPTLARQLLSLRRMREKKAAPPKVIMITFFGGASIQYPTLAEEFIDLREAVRSGALELSMWDHYMTELDPIQNAGVMSLTLFGGFEESALPEEEAEIEGLALQRHLGNISEDSGRILELGVGRGGAQRRTVLKQAILAG